MSILHNLKVGTKLSVLSSILILFIVALALMGWQIAHRLNAECSAMYGTDMQGISQIKDARMNLVASGRALSNMALSVSDEENKGHIKSYETFAALVIQQMTAANTTFTTKEGQAKGTEALAQIKNLQVTQKAAMPMLLNINSTREALSAALTTLRAANTKVGILLDEATTIMMAEAEQRDLHTNELYANATMLNFGSLALALLIAGTLTLAIRKAIAVPLGTVTQKAGFVAEGDLSQIFHLERKDELGDLSLSLDTMVKTLRERIAEAERKTQEAAEQSSKAQVAMEEAHEAKGKAEAGQQAILRAAVEVETVVSRMSAAAEQLSAQVEESSVGMDQQRDRVASSATAMEEMNATVLEVAKNAAVASEGSERARDKAHTGEEIVKDSVKAISSVQEDTKVLKQDMEELGKRAESIGEIMTVISDIADQTNLLALNAAIEAARAGDAGRGFAVVADEVRKLAEKTMTATKEVGDAISGIQQSTRHSITAVERTTINLETTTNLVKKSGESLADIVTESVRTADQVRSIATAAEEQSAASEEITHSLEQINQMTTETATAMQHSAQAVSELNQQNQELLLLVNNLRK